MEQPHCLGRLRPRYKRIGHEVRHGRFGTIRRFRDRKIHSDVAMKTIPFDYKEYGLPSSVLREISVLKELEHENVVRLHDVIYTPEAFILSFEWLETNLAEKIKKDPFDPNQIKVGQVIYDSDEKVPFDPLQIKRFLSQILRGVCYCHSQKVLHRDLQPKNVLIDPATNRLKVADFGAARTFDAAPSEYSVNVGVSAYEAPELLLNMRQITPAVDMWSVGCMFAEIVSRNCLFGGSYYSVMTNIIRILGLPSENEWPGVTLALIKLVDNNTLYGVQIPFDPLQELANVVPNLEATGMDLLSRMLCLTPGRRISARDALEHPYLSGFNSVGD